MLKSSIFALKFFQNGAFRAPYLILLKRNIPISRKNSDKLKFRGVVPCLCHYTSECECEQCFRSSFVGVTKYSRYRQYRKLRPLREIGQFQVKFRSEVHNAV